MKGCFTEKVFVISTLEDGFPLPFISYLFDTPVDEQECFHTHTSSHTTALPPLCTHTKASTHALPNTNWSSPCNMNRHVHTASHLDVTALAGLPFHIKNSTLIIVKATSRWRWICLALAQVMWKLFFSPLSVYVGDNTSYLPSERVSFIYGMTHLWEGAIFFNASHHISSLSQGWDFFCVNMSSHKTNRTHTFQNTHYK